MPLRYSKVLRRIFKEILHMQRIGQLNADTDDKLREYLHTHRKAIRELQRAATRQVAALTPGQLLVELSDFVQRRADKRAPPSLVDLLVNTEQRSDEWLQRPGEHSFNDEMNGIGPEDRQKMDLEPLTQRGLDVSTEQLGYKEYKYPRCGWVHAAITREAMAERTDLAERYRRCFQCGAPSNTFVPAALGDAPRGSTIQGVYVPGAWDDFFTAGPTVSDDFGDGIK